MISAIRRNVGLAVALVLVTAAPALAETQLRLEGFDASSLPKVFAIFDARSGGAKAPEVAATDFRLLEDGKSTTAGTRKLKFRDTGTGVALIVAIDASRSMEGRPWNAIRKGLAELVSRKRPNDRVTVLTFADDIRWETRWDAKPAATERAFRDLRTRGSATRLYDAVGQAMDELVSETREDTRFPPRLCILVLSDGHDEGSRGSLSQVVSRLQASHIRLDAVGLARSPLWLRNLQALATAGFGGFRTASAPEDLARLLNQGTDVLLDSPTLEFHADRTDRDGKTHLMGLEYLPIHWRDQVNVNVPESSWESDVRLWMGVGLALLLTTEAWLYFRSRRPAAPAAAQSPVPVASAAPHRHPETIAETIAPKATVPRTARVPTTLEPRPEKPQPAPITPKPARVATLLASQAAKGATPTSLAAVSGPYAGQRFALSADEFWIGSSANNHLCLSADPAISGNHACIRREEGSLCLYDNGSLNNTMLNGRAIGAEVILLRPGDRIRIGQSELRLEA